MIDGRRTPPVRGQGLRMARPATAPNDVGEEAGGVKDRKVEAALPDADVIWLTFLERDNFGELELGVLIRGLTTTSSGGGQ